MTGRKKERERKEEIAPYELRKELLNLVELRLSTKILMSWKRNMGLYVHRKH